MEVQKDSLVDTDEFDFLNILLYFKEDRVARTKLKYEILLDYLSDNIQY